MKCPCGSEKEYTQCCEPYLLGVKCAQTSEVLMRSRYVAYTTANGKYLVDTTDEENRFESDAELITEHAQSILWIRLDIIKSNENEVEFKAYFQNRSDGSYHVHHEKSYFTFKDNCRYYHSAQLYEDKIQRNEPCPCGSSKKYKKCCI